MSQIDQFLSSLKRALKTKNILYKDLAKALNLSESSVKRILSNKSLSLERLEEICRVADLSFSEVVKSANLDEANQVMLLSDEQEKALAENARLLHYFMMLHEGKTPQKIEREYQIPSAESKKYLFQLDRLNLIELHPRDKVKLKRQGFLRFRRDGPVGKALFEQTKSNYLNYDFRTEDYIRFALIKISPSTLAKYKAKLDRLLMEMQEEAKFEGEHNVPVGDTGILLSFRPWQYSYMGAIKKKD
ncbi:helix-turn-helix transcriptional regulator [Bdellovibrio sp. 22V]|uniref:helix-turn-helix domain-containing protein n=1 Tax=Bdellovibrio TaxID=958 RepID=UPI00254319A8|nr:helix-turn-helix transcriptional regulator [Bdellovibrio sp. 22V]WII72923.1 helix-turn-helix transcriptional regulator [Bdellovibrio sp. 22V]